MRPNPGVGALLATPAFMRLWILGGFSNSMRQFETLAAALFTLQVTHSGFAVAVVSAARMLPMLLLGAPAGVFAEAINRRTILFAGLIITGLVSATLAILAVLGLAQPWHVALGALVSGTVWSTENSTRRRMVGESVEGPLIARALALDSVTNSLTRMAGPLLAGLVFQFAGLTGCFILSAGCYAVAAGLAAGVRHPQVPQRFVPASIPAELAEAVAFARTQPVIAGVLGVTTAMNFFAFCYSALVAPLGEEQFRISAALVGVLAAAEPGGALIGGLLLTGGTPPVSGRTLMIGGSALFMVVIVLMPLSPSFGLATGALFIGGFGTAAFSNMQSALIIIHAPGAIRSRLMGLLTVCIGAGPLGVLTVGALAAHVGNRAALVIMGMAGLMAVAWIGRAWSIAEARRGELVPRAINSGVLAGFGSPLPPTFGGRGEGEGSGDPRRRE